MAPPTPVSATLPNSGWGEPPCGHTAYTPKCGCCAYWVAQPDFVREGVAARAKVDWPQLYNRPTGAALAAGLAKARQVRSRRVPGGKPPPPGLTGRVAPLPAVRLSWSQAVSAFGVATREPVLPAAAPRAAAAPQTGAPAPRGPGAELESMYHNEVGLPPCAECAALARKMDAWGPAGCRERLDEIVADINTRAKLVGLIDKARIAGRLFKAGLPLTVRGQVEEAIRRAETEGRHDPT
jgi:hypothetical protein